MDKLFEKHIESLGYEIYEESAYRDDNGLVWVCSEDESTNDDRQVQTTEYLSADHQHECRQEPTEQPVVITSDPTIASTSPLTYKPI